MNIPIGQPPITSYYSRGSFQLPNSILSQERLTLQHRPSLSPTNMSSESCQSERFLHPKNKPHMRAQSVNCFLPSASPTPDVALGGDIAQTSTIPTLTVVIRRMMRSHTYKYTYSIIRWLGTKHFHSAEYPNPSLHRRVRSILTIQTITPEPVRHWKEARMNHSSRFFSKCEYRL